MTTPSEVDGESFAQQAFKRRRLARPKDLFIDTEFVPPTSNICKRLFSQSKLIRPVARTQASNTGNAGVS
jgi:hypothetical protein